MFFEYLLIDTFISGCGQTWMKAPDLGSGNVQVQILSPGRKCGRSSIGRTLACQAGGCGIVARRSLKDNYPGGNGSPAGCREVRYLEPILFESGGAQLQNSAMRTSGVIGSIGVLQTSGAGSWPVSCS